MIDGVCLKPSMNEAFPRAIKIIYAFRHGKPRLMHLEKQLGNHRGNCGQKLISKSYFPLHFRGEVI